jgi:hypothetical protein
VMCRDCRKDATFDEYCPRHWLVHGCYKNAAPSAVPDATGRAYPATAASRVQAASARYSASTAPLAGPPYPEMGRNP